MKFKAQNGQNQLIENKVFFVLFIGSPPYCIYGIIFQLVLEVYT